MNKDQKELLEDLTREFNTAAARALPVLLGAGLFYLFFISLPGLISRIF